MKFLVASMKKRTSCENSSGNPLQRACSGFLIAAGVSKPCSENSLISWKLFRKPAMNVHWKKRQMRAKESRNRNLIRLSEQFLEAGKNLIFIFLLN